jgi:hypothetical protein
MTTVKEMLTAKRLSDQQGRQLLQMLAVPDPTRPPSCPLCGSPHRLEQRCVLPRLSEN